MNPEPELRLLQDLESEVARWRRRTLFLVSVIVHGIFIWILLFAPNLFHRGAEMMGINLRRARKPETTYLWLPPDVLKRLREPDTPTLSDKNRRAQGRSPIVDPNGLRMPYLRGNTPLPEVPGGGQPVPPAAPPAPPPAGGTAATPAPPAPKQEDNQEARLRLMDVPEKPEGGGDPRLRLPLSTPSNSIREAAQAAARNRAAAGVPGPGEGTSQFENLHPNFSTEAPIILSDTQGVDFGPYLARVVYVVRHNWYQVIPESARLGMEKGRVAIVFEIVKDGSVPQLRLVGSSGSDPLDRAALAGIRASIPFPPLPTEFTGNHLVLQFIFLYNIGYTNP